MEVRGVDWSSELEAVRNDYVVKCSIFSLPEIIIYSLYEERKYVVMLIIEQLSKFFHY